MKSGELRVGDFLVFVWVFALAVTLHMLEEVIWLPAWSVDAGGWHEPVGRKEFGFAAVVFLLLLYGLCFLGGEWWVANGRVGVWGSEAAVYLLCGLAVVMAANIFVPHLGATIAQRRYAPGLATAVVFNLPAAALLLWSFFAGGDVRVFWFFVALGVMVITAVWGWPLLFKVFK